MIVSLGFLHNMASLLASSGDDISDMSGHDLVRDKVASIFIMGGSYPRSLVPSFNFGCADGLMGDAAECGGSAQAAVSLLPPEVKVIIIINGHHASFTIIARWSTRASPLASW